MDLQENELPNREIMVESKRWGRVMLVVFVGNFESEGLLSPVVV